MCWRNPTTTPAAASRRTRATSANRFARDHVVFLAMLPSALQIHRKRQKTGSRLTLSPCYRAAGASCKAGRLSRDVPRLCRDRHERHQSGFPIPCMRRGLHPPYPPPFASGGKSATRVRKGGKPATHVRRGKAGDSRPQGWGSWRLRSFSPLAKGGHRGVLRVPPQCTRFVIPAIENRSSRGIWGCSHHNTKQKFPRGEQGLFVRVWQKICTNIMNHGRYPIAKLVRILLIFCMASDQDVSLNWLGR